MTFKRKITTKMLFLQCHVFNLLDQYMDQCKSPSQPLPLIKKTKGGGGGGSLGTQARFLGYADVANHKYPAHKITLLTILSLAS